MKLKSDHSLLGRAPGTDNEKKSKLSEIQDMNINVLSNRFENSLGGREPLSIGRDRSLQDFSGRIFIAF